MIRVLIDFLGYLYTTSLGYKIKKINFSLSYMSKLKLECDCLNKNFCCKVLAGVFESI
jgi:hypothetical protein